MKLISYPALCHTAVLLLVCSIVPNAAFSAEDKNSAVLAEGPGSIQITAADIRAEGERIPPKSRAEVLGNPVTVAEAASNLYFRRALAAEAIKDGLDNDPVVQAQLRVARDRVLSDARLAVIDKSHQPSEAALAQYAKAAYQADPRRFAAPEQIRARHILIKGSGVDSRSKAEGLLADLKNGADFSMIARKSSDDSGSAEKGGDLGFFAKGRMVKPFDDAAFSLEKPGDLSSVVESQFGFHIIELVEKRTPSPKPFAEVEPELKEAALAQSSKDSRDSVAKRLSEQLKLDQPAIEAFAATYE